MAEVQSAMESQGGQHGALSCLELPSFADASGLVRSPYSCLVVETHRRHLALSPKFLRKKRTGIKEQLNTELLRYDTGLDGVPVAYDNIKLVGELADIFDDLGHIHINIEADFVIFRPEYGQKLVGVVNKVAPSHIGCLVHGCFNASVPKPPKMPVDAWLQLDLKIGDHMEFMVSRLDSDAVGVFCIRGRLEARMETLAMERLNDVNKNQETDKPEQTVSVPASSDAVLETDTGGEGNPKKKSKKRKYQETVEENELETQVVTVDQSILEESLVASSNPLVGEISKKGKKRRKRHDTSLLSSDLDDGNLSHATGDNSLELRSGIALPEIKQSRESKKKKHRDNSDVEVGHSFQNGMTGDAVIGENSASEEPEKKHKNKHKISFVTQDSEKDLSYGTESSEQLEPVDQHLELSQIPRKRKHKNKHNALLLQSDELSRQVESSSLGSDSTKETSKAKKKRA